MIIQNTIEQASRILKKNNIDTSNLDAEIILANLLKVEKEFFISNSNKHIPENLMRKFNFAIKRRIKREPVAYIIGRKEFWSKDFLVNKATLIPRPETELLVYKVVNYFKNKSVRILDIGTGSGCILLSILKELKNSKGHGIDISSNAIKVAKINSIKLNINDRAKFQVCDIKNFFGAKYDLIVSNPPYVLLQEIKNLSRDIKNYEPINALNGGIDGLDVVRKVIYKSSSLLKRNGIIAIEIGNRQYKQVSKLLSMKGFREISKVCDYKSNVRCIISTKM